MQSTFADRHGATVSTDPDSLFSTGQRGFGNTVIRVDVAKADYTKLLTKKIKLETGARGTFTYSSSSSGIESLVNGSWVTGIGAVNDIHMKEGIAAAYASVTTQVDDKTSLVLGGRYEYSHTHMEEANSGKNVVDRRLGVFFPGIFLSRKLNDHADWQLSYTKRISRPSYNDLASYIRYNDPVSVFTGNPLLQPTITNNLKLGFNDHGYSLSVLLSRDIHPIAQGQLTENTTGDLVYISPQNLTWQNNLTLQANIPWRPAPWWNMNYGFDGGWRRFRIDYTLTPAAKTYFGYSLNASTSFKLPAGFSAELSGWYNGTSWYGAGKVDGYGAVNAGIKKELKNNRGTIQLSATDLFRDMSITSYIGALTEEAYQTKARINWNAESERSPIFKLTYSRSFGVNKPKSPNQPGAGAKEENDRVRQ